ncbi:predicted protein [Chaetomium globosum CBS 148.51]|uniref:Uncharacterized protein n=1 Tax=Chaetomium globosum (strain ATCC 6205 / CBS 148.51 / DSM 1962 / NBRC 6347 / NRRL 1970) TaxID=306901 RepID=Q2H7P5_CHAGB|nr:uncharacterized protein CHGG_05320 [Chaetomium globosum CBS 148.51]EAQ88701.1 predicted protein [Chaetomium globosum CBS 148.51]
MDRRQGRPPPAYLIATAYSKSGSRLKPITVGSELGAAHGDKRLMELNGSWLISRLIPMSWTLMKRLQL